ncbi:hypothetical protein [Streptomyces sp. NBC_00470]|uniref:hypothetical protein n=1 Tax=Streptomyces sp. NBC_00470 TaxID=2975753 RepID=UPI002F915086
MLRFIGPDRPWFGREHVLIEDLRRAYELLLQRDQEQRAVKGVRQPEEQRRADAHERHIVEQAAARTRRDAALQAQITWQLVPADCAYDWDGNQLPFPEARRPIRAEESVLRVARRPGTVFHDDALNSPFFRDVPVEERFQHLRNVVDKLLRAPTKGTVAVERDHIAVSGQKVTLTLTPDCTMVRTLNPLGPNPLNSTQYNGKR